MALDVREEFSWQDMRLRRLKRYGAADTSTILVPGQKLKRSPHPRTRFTAMAKKKIYFIRVLASPLIYNALLNFFIIPHFVFIPDDTPIQVTGGGNKMAMEVVKELSWQDMSLCRLEL
jgi:hypothetical protein